MVTEHLYIIHILDEERVRAVLGEATKKEDFLNKFLLPRKPLYDKRSKSSYWASSLSRTTSTTAGGSRSYRGKSGRGVPRTDKERRSSRGADRSSLPWTVKFISRKDDEGFSKDKVLHCELAVRCCYTTVPM